MLTALLLLLGMQAPATQAKWLGQKPCKPDEKGYLLTLVSDKTDGKHATPPHASPPRALPPHTTPRHAAPSRYRPVSPPLHSPNLTHLI